MDDIVLRTFLLQFDGALFDQLWVDPSNPFAVWAASSSGGVLDYLGLAEGRGLSVDHRNWLGAADTPFVFSAMDMVDTNRDSILLLPNARTGGVSLQTETNTGELVSGGLLTDLQNRPLTLSRIAMADTGEERLFVATPPNGSSLHLYRLDDTYQQASLLDTVTDTAKSTLSNVSDILTLTLGNTEFVIAASSVENGISAYSLSGSSLELTDTLGPKDGLWINGMEDIAALSAGGQGFVIGVSSASGTLSAIRINPMGALFLTDIILDDQTTRFGGAVALDTFQANDRNFIVTGGTDGGIALFELLPRGQLLHHQSIAQSNGWDVGNILSIQAVVTGSEVQIILGGSEALGLVQLVLPLSNLGLLTEGTGQPDTLSGAANDDLLMGLWGNDQITGNAGADTLIAGPGQDTLTGGAGADVFMFTADGQTDTINDFQLGQDQINLDDWGMIYDISALTIQARSWGAILSWRNEVIHVHSDDGVPLAPDSWSIDDFLF